MVEMMRAAMIHGPGELRIDAVPRPEPLLRDRLGRRSFVSSASRPRQMERGRSSGHPFGRQALHGKACLCTSLNGTGVQLLFRWWHVLVW
jgi:hypothetical protein